MMEKELENIDSTILALQCLLCYSYIEKSYIEACIKNPSLSNLKVLSNFRELRDNFLLRDLKDVC